MPDAIETMLALDYPRYEVIAVDDRSDDATGAILEAAAKKDARLKTVRVDSLPAGWLGKPHALEKAYEQSSGEWLVFTDADVHFRPDLLRRVIALAEMKGWDHLTLLAAPKLHTFGEKMALTFFGICFLLGTRPWRANDPKSRGYTGIGAFQIVRRGAYEESRNAPAAGDGGGRRFETRKDREGSRISLGSGARRGYRERALARGAGQLDSRD